MIEKDLFDLKEKIEDAKTQTNELTGQLKAVMKQLKESNNVNSVREVHALIIKIDEKIEAIDEQIKQGLKKLEEYET